MAKRKSTSLGVVHCSATKPSQDIGADEIDKWHRARGWKGGIGYHYVIRRNALIELGRPIDDIGAHALGVNKTSVGICLVGGIDDAGEPDDNFEPKQKRSLQFIINLLGMIYPGIEFVGHRDLSPDIDGDGVIEEWEWLKSCPCFDVHLWMRAHGLK